MKNIFKIFVLVTFFQCSTSDKRPTLLHQDKIILKSNSLTPYFNPPCSLAFNTVYSDFINLIFNITDVKRTSNDVIEAWDRNNINNKVIISFNPFFIQDGIYSNNPNGGKCHVQIKGDQYSNQDFNVEWNNGNVYVKFYETYIDLYICNAGISYIAPNNGIKRSTNYSAHFKVPL